MNDKIKIVDSGIWVIVVLLALILITLIGGLNAIEEAIKVCGGN
ncbi:MAG: hypothetical protein AABY22_21250 [Nanoarchaeota archaeon]